MTCESYNVVYMISCQKENGLKNYIGESERNLKHRSHSLADMEGIALDE